MAKKASSKKRKRTRKSKKNPMEAAHDARRLQYNKRVFNATFHQPTPPREVSSAGAKTTKKITPKQRNAMAELAAAEIWTYCRGKGNTLDSAGVEAWITDRIMTLVRDQNARICKMSEIDNEHKKWRIAAKRIIWNLVAHMRSRGVEPPKDFKPPK